MDFVTIILAAAKSVGISGSLLLAICTHESGLKNVKVPYDNGSASYGICQVKFSTAKGLGHKGNAQDLMNPEINAKWAAEYLKYQLKRYNYNIYKATAAYNSGRYNESTKKPGFAKNHLYVKKVQKKLPEFSFDKIHYWRIPMRLEK
jgi:soluble lytic murein transglycosylase-like protein